MSESLGTRGGGALIPDSFGKNCPSTGKRRTNALKPPCASLTLTDWGGAVGPSSDCSALATIGSSRS
jgi:hypothetical protein